MLGLISVMALENSSRAEQPGALYGAQQFKLAHCRKNGHFPSCFEAYRRWSSVFRWVIPLLWGPALWPALL